MREKTFRFGYTGGSSYYRRKNRELPKPDGETDRKVDFSQFLVLIAGVSLLAGGIFGIVGSFIAAGLVMLITFAWSKIPTVANQRHSDIIANQRRQSRIEQLTWLSHIMPLLIQIVDSVAEKLFYYNKHKR